LDGQLAIEDDKRLGNANIREHFLRKLYVLADFRENTGKEIKDLIDYHSRNKLMFKAYNEKELRIMRNIVANHDNKPYNDLKNDYKKRLLRTMVRAPQCGNYVNVLQNTLGYFSDKLTKAEKDFFLEKLHQYKERKIPLLAPIDIMNSWIVRFDEKYLKQQSFFNPYPEGLLDVDSIVKACDGRDYWKE
jgi:uncharacterized protein YbgA (DUF1722 family)